MKIIQGILVLAWIALPVSAMDMPIKREKDVVYVATSDGQAEGIARWKINQMKTLLVLLEHQRHVNNVHNPIHATMINSEELQLLSDALESIPLGKFEDFYNTIVQEDLQRLTPGQTVLSLDQGKIRTLINAAERVQASGVSAFCLSNIMLSDEQKTLLVPLLIDDVKLKALAMPMGQFLDGHLESVDAVIFSPDGRKIVSGGWGEQNNLIIWDAETGKQLNVLVGHPNSVYAIAFSPDGSKIVSGGWGARNNLILWDAATGAQLKVFEGHPGYVAAVAFSPDGSKIVSGGQGAQNNLIIWDALTGEKLHDLDGHPDNVKVVAFSPDGKKIVSGCFCDQNNLIVWNAETGEKLQVLKGHSQSVAAVLFSPEGSTIVSGSTGKQSNVIIWDAETGKQLQVLKGYTYDVGAMAFSPDGSKIVLGCWGTQNNLIIWDIATGTQLPIFGEYNVISVSFSPDGNKIAAGAMSDYDNLILFSFLTAQEEKTLYNCTFAQAYTIYQLVLASTCGLKSPFMADVFNRLPLDIQNILEKYFEISLEK